jgi:hypothetical protein
MTSQFRRSIGPLAIVTAILLILHGLSAQLGADESRWLIGDTPAIPLPLGCSLALTLQHRVCLGAGVFLLAGSELYRMAR